MRSALLDTVGILAILDTADQWHHAAAASMTELRRERCRFVTTSFVLLECGNAAARTAYRNEVTALRDELQGFGNLIVPTEADEREGWMEYSRSGAGGAGIVDNISFAVMRRLGITLAFTNDRHFTAAGFQVLF